MLLDTNKQRPASGDAGTAGAGAAEGGGGGFGGDIGDITGTVPAHGESERRVSCTGTSVFCILCVFRVVVGWWWIFVVVLVSRLFLWGSSAAVFLKERLLQGRENPCQNKLI